jgi:LysR family tcuABC transcriptional regulator
MELRQMRYFVQVVEAGSIGRAAKEMALVPSALSQQLTRLESELSTRLLHRTATGVKPTDAGLAFYEHAQLALRHTDAAAHSARHARLAGHVSVGISPSSAAVLALPFVQTMKQRYPDIHVRLVGSLSLSLASMLNARQLDMAVLFETSGMLHGSNMPLVEERMFLIGDRSLPQLKDFQDRPVTVQELKTVPLVLGSQLLRRTVDDAFARAGARPDIVLEIDGLEVLMDMVGHGIAATVQCGGATVRLPADRFGRWEIADSLMRRKTLISTLSEPELTPAALAARLVLRDVARKVVAEGKWPGAAFTNRDEIFTAT